MIKKKQVPKLPQTCRHCGYQWESRSRMNYVCCPHCKYSTPTVIPPETAAVIHSDELVANEKAKLAQDKDYNKSIKQLCEERAIDEETAQLILSAVKNILEAAKKGNS